MRISYAEARLFKARLAHAEMVALEDLEVYGRGRLEDIEPKRIIKDRLYAAFDEFVRQFGEGGDENGVQETVVNGHGPAAR